MATQSDLRGAFKSVPTWIPVVTIIVTALITGGSTYGVSQYRLNDYDKRIEQVTKDFHDTNKTLTENITKLAESFRTMNDSVIRLEEQVKNLRERR